MFRFTVHCFLAVSLGVLFSENASAAAPPLLKAKGNQQQCESLEVWTKAAERMGGEGLIGPDIMGGIFVIKITPAFADSVFEPLVGKPYRNLSKSEKKKIYKIVDRCLTKEGTRSFLPLAFDTSSRPKNSTHRDLLAAIENVNEADAANARAAADARAESQRQFNEGRPQLVARSFSGDPKAIKRQRLTKEMCYATRSGWHFRYNDYVFNGNAVVARNDGLRAGIFPTCNTQYAMQQFIPNVSSLVRMSQPNMTLFSIGDICGKNPEVLFLYPNLGYAMPKYDEYPRRNRHGQSVPHFRNIGYHFFVSSGSDGVLRKGIINPVESGILATREILMKQCRTVPDSIRVVGAVLEKDMTPKRPSLRSRVVPKKLDYWEFYSGTFYPLEPEKRLVHDDQRLAETYAAMANEYGAHVQAARGEAENASDGSLALGFFLLVLAGQYMADPCNDVSIPYEDRERGGCFD